jgi:hypothetical protein
MLPIGVRRFRAPLLLIGLLVCCWLGPARASAQTADPLFGDWRFSPEPPGSRPAGMGSAYVALADSVKAAAVNPAGLALVPAWELNLSSLRAWAGAAGGTRKVRVAAYASATDSRSGAQGGGRLSAEMSEIGLAAGATLLPRLSVGVAASA